MERLSCLGAALLFLNFPLLHASELMVWKNQRTL